METFKDQIHRNIVALISLSVAIFALWTDGKTDRNRTTRIAGFEILKNLGELQMIVNDIHYNHSSESPFKGWGRVSLISDLSELLPPPVPQTVAKLATVWGENWKNIPSDEEAATEVSTQIDASRNAVLKTIRYL